MLELFKRLIKLMLFSIMEDDINSNANLRCTAIDVLEDMKINPGRFCNPQALKKKMEEILQKTKQTTST